MNVSITSEHSAVSSIGICTTPARMRLWPALMSVVKGRHPTNLNSKSHSPRRDESPLSREKRSLKGHGRMPWCSVLFLRLQACAARNSGRSMDTGHRIPEAELEWIVILLPDGSRSAPRCTMPIVVARMQVLACRRDRFMHQIVAQPLIKR